MASNYAGRWVPTPASAAQNSGTTVPDGASITWAPLDCVQSGSTSSLLSIRSMLDGVDAYFDGIVDLPRVHWPLTSADVVATSARFIGRRRYRPARWHGRRFITRTSRLRSSRPERPSAPTSCRTRFDYLRRSPQPREILEGFALPSVVSEASSYNCDATSLQFGTSIGARPGRWTQRLT